jgi:hypothetical protein
LLDALERRGYDGCTDYADDHPYWSLRELLMGLELDQSERIATTFLTALLWEATERNDIERLARSLFVRLLSEIAPDADAHGGAPWCFETALHRLTHQLPAAYYAPCMRIVHAYRTAYRRGDFPMAWRPLSADDLFLVELFKSDWAEGDASLSVLPPLHAVFDGDDDDDDEAEDHEPTPPTRRIDSSK